MARRSRVFPKNPSNSSGGNKLNYAFVVIAHLFFACLFVCCLFVPPKSVQVSLSRRRDLWLVTVGVLRLQLQLRFPPKTSQQQKKVFVAPESKTYPGVRQWGGSWGSGCRFFALVLLHRQTEADCLQDSLVSASKQTCQGADGLLGKHGPELIGLSPHPTPPIPPIPPPHPTRCSCCHQLTMMTWRCWCCCCCSEQ